MGVIKRDPIRLLEASNVGRVADLVPIRYGRMLTSPFAAPELQSCQLSYKGLNENFCPAIAASAISPPLAMVNTAMPL